MTSRKKLAIALAVALPLVVLGAGIAIAADEIPGLKAGDGATASSFATTNVAQVSSPVSVNDDCTGPCTRGTGGCDGSGICVSGAVCDSSGVCVSGAVCYGSGVRTPGSEVCRSPRDSNSVKSYSENLTSSSTCPWRCSR